MRVGETEAKVGNKALSLENHLKVSTISSCSSREDIGKEAIDLWFNLYFRVVGWFCNCKLYHVLPSCQYLVFFFKETIVP